ncbi:hypothetical protein Pmani_030309 [Petrolisthes manimaculis]|uniref:long-chain-fatty-acid--CoA ligase n=2 Tax=Petrolisthes manimaculis TaxID=1843537 RepID=A0AAE1NWA5_9EUCA|nr:hypothetical protein Pmani_030309 [Petrolisthes manimaculis]
MWPSAVAVGVGSVLWYSTYVNSCLLAAIIAAVYVSAGGSLTLWQVYRTFPRDCKALGRFIKLQLFLRRVKRKNLSVPKVFQEVVQQNKGKVAFYFEDQKWTFDEVEEYSNQVANYFAGHGVQHGDSVALLMENRVEYICMWLGLTKLGAVPALVNFNLREDPLVHCIKVASCKLIVCGAELQEALCDIKDREAVADLPVYVSGAGKDSLKCPGAIDLDAGLASAATSSPPQIDNVNFGDDMVFIYTSGTTGLPKAAIIKHSRAFFAAAGMGTMIGLTPSDIVYDPLPLYHTTGGIIGVGQALFLGSPVAIRRKFSATQYWNDCIKYGCTAAQYIGEMCRYLLNIPRKPEDTKHQIRMMFGNGLRPNIWKEFESTFNIPTICEFYGSTEGNANIINIDGKPGAVGFVSVLFPAVYPVALIKVDEETKQVVRDENGLCLRCKPGEAGEFIGKIVKNDPVRDFHGYADKTASSKKVVRDVFAKGDSAFLSGDILVMDDEGYLFFKDRTGDTFRWKGENVSTGEVEGVVSRCAGHKDVVVYGVEVPGAEGRAGMAAIIDDAGTLDLEQLYSSMTRSLPSYARPLFLRTVKQLEMTGTFKLKKVTIQKEGFDPTIVKDPLYFLDAKLKTYVPLTIDLYQTITAGKVRV